MNITSDDEDEVVVEVHDGQEVLRDYPYELFHEIDCEFRVRNMDKIVKIYEEIQKRRYNDSSQLYFLDKMTLADFVEFCLECSFITLEAPDEYSEEESDPEENIKKSEVAQNYKQYFPGEKSFVDVLLEK